MKAEEIWNFIVIGTSLRFLQDCREGTPIHGKSWIVDNIDRFLEYLEKLNLRVTERASYKLLDMRKNLKKKKKTAVVSKEDANNIGSIVDDIRKTLVAETRGQFVYVISDKKLDVIKLTNNVSKLFSRDVFDLCPEIARYDFKEAGKCIAFENPTAAAFHTLRGTEAVLREYYKRFIRPAKQNPNWGPIIVALRGKTKGRKPDSILLNNLDNIRDSFRNPTQHPEKMYDMEEAQGLFSLCIDAVNRMCKEIKPKQ